MGCDDKGCSDNGDEEEEGCESECEENGVVFSEIEGRENSELDLCESAVHRLVFPGSGYENDLGGSTAGIASVTREDLLAYHKSLLPCRGDGCPHRRVL